MKTETLNRANKLNRDIQELNRALSCFEWQPEDGITISLKPQLVIEYDDDGGRERHHLPMDLSNDMVEFFKSEIIKNRDAAIEEFNSL